MKKQSDLHGPTRVRESESVISNAFNPGYSSSKPKGVMDHNHPGHVSRGAAESKANPVSDRPPSGTEGGKKQH
jgi:hypothetical protein